MRNKRKTKFKSSKCINSCKSTRKRKHMNTRRMQRGGAIIHFDLQGDDEPIDGKHYEVIESDDNVPFKWIYHGNVKVISSPQSEICRENARCEAPPLHYVVDGRGVFVQFNDGIATTTYDGSFINNKKMGHGKMTYADGSVYTGNWDNDMLSGWGTMKYADGSVYTGNWDDNVKSGIGSIKHTDGGNYKGHLKNNEKSGKGRMEYPDGDVYMGDWAEDEPNGKGKFTFKTSELKEYNGDFKDGYMHGKGIMLMRNGDQYNGDFVDGDMNGKGIMIDSNGRTLHDGYWKDDKPVDLFGRSIHK